MISFCYPIKNRTIFVSNHKGNKVLTTPLINSVRSVVNSFASKDEFEIVISDFGSTDTNFAWLEEMDVNYKIIKINHHDGHFSRGHGLNVAAKHAIGDIIFFIDADMLIDQDFIKEAKQILSNENYDLYFPICWSYNDPEHETGWWRYTGYGNVLVNRDHWFGNNLSWWERDCWGREDGDLFKKTAHQAARQNARGFFHMWHDEAAHLSSVYLECPS